MKQPKHTPSPGPWTTSHGWIYQGDSDIAVARVCDTIPNIHVFESGESQANAHLIAAAPEMLEALESCLVRLETFKTDSYAREFNQALRAVIAKARGES